MIVFRLLQVSCLSILLFSCSAIKPLGHIEGQADPGDDINDLNLSDSSPSSELTPSQVIKSQNEVSKNTLAKKLVKHAIHNHFADGGQYESTNQVLGTSNLGESDKTKGDVYFLWGAEHLKLENNYFDIPVKYNAAVKKWIDYFLSRGKPYFERYVERSGRYAPVIGKILEAHGLPRDLIFLAMAESGFQNKAKSWAKAVGPWQFMPFTGKRYGLEINWYLDERRDPIKATIAAARYLKDLYQLFGSWELAAAGYNAGEGKVSRAIKRYRTQNFWKIRKGRYLKRETKNYVPKIMALAILGKNLKSFGMGDIDFKQPLDFDEIEVPASTDLFKVAELSGVDFQEIHRLNPELMRWITPPHQKRYSLRLPVGTKQLWASCCKGHNLTAEDFQQYKVARRASLTQLGRKFKVPAEVLADLNGVPKNKRLVKATIVDLPFRRGQSRKDPMYADLYERKSRRGGRYRRYKRQVKRALRRGRKIASPSVFYTVKKGDTLWKVSRTMGVGMNTLIRSNYHIVKKRMIRAGDRLAIR
jgi:membrane-bound lytic murein transglycosylase D